jgi:hypothetical protein
MGPELSPFQGLLLLVGWLVVAVVVIVGFAWTLGIALYVVVRTYERFVARIPPEQATPPPWPWGRPSANLESPTAPGFSASTVGSMPVPFGPGRSSEPVASQSLFVCLVMSTQDGDVGVYLVNNTALAFTRVMTRTGMYAELDTSLLESTVGTRERGSLGPFQALLVEESPWWERDFYIWYQFSLSLAGSPEVLNGTFGIPRDVWTPAKARLPLLDRDGFRLFDRPRSGIPTGARA